MNGVNAAVPTHQDDPEVAGLQEQASVSDSKLQALLHQVPITGYAQIYCDDQTSGTGTRLVPHCVYTVHAVLSAKVENV